MCDVLFVEFILYALGVCVALVCVTIACQVVVRWLWRLMTK